jgi:hypothetical protein
VKETRWWHLPPALGANKSNQNEHKIDPTSIRNGGDHLGMGYGTLQKITVTYRDFLDAAPFINITTAHSPSRIGLTPS